MMQLTPIALSNSNLESAEATSELDRLSVANLASAFSIVSARTGHVQQIRQLVLFLICKGDRQSSDGKESSSPEFIISLFIKLKSHFSTTPAQTRKINGFAITIFQYHQFAN